MEDFSMSLAYLESTVDCCDDVRGKENLASCSKEAATSASTRHDADSISVGAPPPKRVGARRRSNRFCRVLPSVQNPPSLIPMGAKERRSTRVAPGNDESSSLDTPSELLVTEDYPVGDVSRPRLTRKTGTTKFRRPTSVNPGTLKKSTEISHDLKDSLKLTSTRKNDELPSANQPQELPLTEYPMDQQPPPRRLRKASKTKSRSVSLNSTAPVIPTEHLAAPRESLNSTVACPEEASSNVCELGEPKAVIESEEDCSRRLEEKRRRADRRRSRVFSMDPDEDRILQMLGRRPMTTENVMAAFLEQKNSPLLAKSTVASSSASPEISEVVGTSETRPSAEKAESGAETSPLANSGEEASLGVRRSKRSSTSKPVQTEPEKSIKRRRSSIGKKASPMEIIDDEAVLKFIYDPEIAKKSYEVTAGTPLETIFEDDEKILSKTKSQRLTVYPTDPAIACTKKRKSRKLRATKAGLKVPKGCGAIFDKKGRLDAKKLEALSEEMENLLS